MMMAFPFGTVAFPFGMVALQKGALPIATVFLRKVASVDLHSIVERMVSQIV